jgi:hypothetical protein
VGSCKEKNGVIKVVSPFFFGSAYIYVVHLTKTTKISFGWWSGSIVSDYGLDDRAIEVRSPTGAEDFCSSPCVQTGGSFSGGKARPGRDADHSPPSSAEVKNE